MHSEHRFNSEQTIVLLALPIWRYEIKYKYKNTWTDQKIWIIFIRSQLVYVIA